MEEQWLRKKITSVMTIDGEKEQKKILEEQ